MSRRAFILVTLVLALVLVPSAPVASALPEDDWLDCVVDGGTLYLPDLSCCPRDRWCLPPSDGLRPDGSG